MMDLARAERWHMLPLIKNKKISMHNEVLILGPFDPDFKREIYQPMSQLFPFSSYLSLETNFHHFVPSILFLTCPLHINNRNVKGYLCQK